MTSRAPFSILPLYLSVMFFPPLAATESDIAKKQHWAEQVADTSSNSFQQGG